MDSRRDALRAALLKLGDAADFPLDSSEQLRHIWAPAKVAVLRRVGGVHSDTGRAASVEDGKGGSDEAGAPTAADAVACEGEATWSVIVFALAATVPLATTEPSTSLLWGTAVPTALQLAIDGNRPDGKPEEATFLPDAVEALWRAAAGFGCWALDQAATAGFAEAAATTLPYAKAHPIITVHVWRALQNASVAAGATPKFARRVVELFLEAQPATQRVDVALPMWRAVARAANEADSANDLFPQALTRVFRETFERICVAGPLFGSDDATGIAVDALWESMLELLRAAAERLRKDFATVDFVRAIEISVPFLRGASGVVGLWRAVDLISEGSEEHFRSDVVARAVAATSFKATTAQSVGALWRALSNICVPAHMSSDVRAANLVFVRGSTVEAWIRTAEFATSETAVRWMWCAVNNFCLNREARDLFARPEVVLTLRGAARHVASDIVAEKIWAGVAAITSSLNPEPKAVFGRKEVVEAMVATAPFVAQGARATHKMWKAVSNICELPSPAVKAVFRCKAVAQALVTTAAAATDPAAVTWICRAVDDIGGVFGGDDDGRTECVGHADGATVVTALLQLARYATTADAVKWLWTAAAAAGRTGSEVQPEGRRSAGVSICNPSVFCDALHLTTPLATTEEAARAVWFALQSTVLPASTLPTTFW